MTKESKTLVKMQDGREVAFTAKAQWTQSVADDGDTVEIKFDFRNGETITLSVDSASDIFLQAAVKGFVAQVSENALPFKGNDLEDVIESVRMTVDRLNEGRWTAERERDPLAGASALVKALVQFTGADPATVRANVADLSLAKRRALAESAELKPLIEAIQAQKPRRANIEASDLLARIAATAAAEAA